jgi:hypothetical protein
MVSAERLIHPVHRHTLREAHTMTTYAPANPHRPMRHDIDPWSVPLYVTMRGTKLPSGYANHAARTVLRPRTAL